MRGVSDVMGDAGDNFSAGVIAVRVQFARQCDCRALSLELIQDLHAARASLLDNRGYHRVSEPVQKTALVARGAVCYRLPRKLPGESR